MEFAKNLSASPCNEVLWNDIIFRQIHLDRHGTFQKLYFFT
jgi:hypothetical protein